MELVRVTYESNGENRIKICGHVTYSDDPNNEEIYWYDVPAALKDSFSRSGNPWIVCLLPLAMTLGESLIIRYPVDSLLMENLKKLMVIWRNWYPHLHDVDIVSTIIDETVSGSNGKNMVFFLAVLTLTSPSCVD